MIGSRISLRPIFLGLMGYLGNNGETTKLSSIKVMVAFGKQTFDLINGEAKERGVTVQELLRAVIIPDWVKQNVSVRRSSTSRSSNGNGISQARLPINGSSFQPTVTRIRE